MSYEKLFVKLFRGRGDAHGSWEGGCVREPLLPEHFEHHLHSENPAHWIGVYNVIGEHCSWGVVDIDIKDHELASNVHQSLWSREIPAWIEATTRGFHVWVFPEDLLVPAHIMRRALTAACLAADYHPKEVFPKQESASGRSLGNYVRLPLNGAYSGHSLADTRRFSEGVTLVQMDTHRATTHELIRAAELLPRPQAVNNPVDLNAGLDSQETVHDLGGLVERIWRDGPLTGDDRSTTLAKLAHLCREAGADQSTTLTVVASADDRWGKGFMSRPGGVGLNILRKIVTNAWIQ